MSAVNVKDPASTGDGRGRGTFGPVKGSDLQGCGRRRGMSPRSGPENHVREEWLPVASALSARETLR